MTAEYDFVVVGAGSTGCVVASRLAARTGASVCLLEAGPPDGDRGEILELGRWPELVGSPYEQQLAAQLSGRALTYRRGLVQGGSGSLNGCVAWRAPARDLSSWTERGAAGWGPEECARFFDRVEAQTGVETASPGTLGAAFVAAARQAGHPEVDFARHGAQAGVGAWAFTKRGPLRRSSSVAYLHEAPPATLTVHTDARVTGIVIDGGVARAVRTTTGDVVARREIVVSAGALGSAQLLMLSGIGPADHLGDLGIDVVADLPVGTQLHDHAIVGTRFELTGARRQPALLGTDAVLLSGSRADGVPEVMIWPYEGHHEEFHVEGARPATPECSLVVMVLHPHNAATVRLRSADAADAPAIQLRSLADPADQQVLADGLRTARELARQQPLAALLGAELDPGPSVAGAALVDYVAATVEPANHLSGTCRMGRAGESVVDERLRVRGVGALRVADASVFADNIGVNPNLTCLMIGERCADFLAADAAAEA